MKEYVQSAKDADQLRNKARELTEAIGLNNVGEFGAEYIAREIIHTGTLDSYNVYPSAGTSDYVIVNPINGRSAGGESGRISSGPIGRLRENGFIVTQVGTYEGVEDPTLIKTDATLPDKYLAVYVKYVGAEHPIVEYWEDE